MATTHAPSATPASASDATGLSLPVVGMTCASCVNRIERFLGRADGVVQANVNLATERATVRFDPALIGRTGIVAAIEAAGYNVGREAALEDRCWRRRGRPSEAPYIWVKPSGRLGRACLSSAPER